MSLERKILRPGTWVRWESQSQGSWVTKQGEILAHLKAGDRISDGYELKDGKVAKTPDGLVRISQHDRVVIAVVANPKTGLRKIYAPLLSVVSDDAALMGHEEVKTLLAKSKKPTKKAAKK